MRKHYLTMLGSLLMATGAFSQQYDWVLDASDSAEDRTLAVAFDDMNNMYAAGQFGDVLDFGAVSIVGTDLPGSDRVDGWLTKFDPDGNAIWSIAFPGPNNQIVRAISVQRTSGDIYITGSFSGTITLGMFLLTSTDFTDGFIARVNTFGYVEWAYAINMQSGNLTPNGICLDNTNTNVYIGGSATSGTQIDFANSGATVIKTGTGAFLAKYSTSGLYRWCKVDNSTGNAVTSIAVDQTDNVYATGNATSGYTWEGAAAPVVVSGGSDIFVVKYTKNGIFRYTSQVSGTGYESDPDIDADANGNIYLTGHYNSTITLGATVLTPAGVYAEGFLAKANRNGVVQWAKRIYSQGGIADMHMQLDALNNTYITGSFSDTLYYGNKKLRNLIPGDHDELFTIKFGPAGAAYWSKLAYNDNNSYMVPCDISVRTNDYVLIGGYSNADMHFGLTTLVNEGDDDLFVATILDCPDYVFTIDIASTTICDTETVVASLPAYSGLVYNWYLNGFPVIWDTNISTLDISTGGDYYCVIDGPGCTYYSDTVSITEIICKEQSPIDATHAILLTPNPAQTSFYIADAELQEGVLQFSDMAGKVVLEVGFHSGASISVADLPEGMYEVVILRDGAILYTDKLMIVR